MSSANDVQALLERRRLLISRALCTVAEADLYTHNSPQAFALLRTVRRAVGDISAFTGPSWRISSARVRKLEKLLSELETSLTEYQALLAQISAVSVG